jgi:hypothetical protein
VLAGAVPGVVRTSSRPNVRAIADVPQRAQLTDDRFDVIVSNPRSLGGGRVTLYPTSIASSAGG